MNLQINKTKKGFRWTLGLMWVLVLVACQTTSSHTGKLAGPMSRVDLATSGEHRGTWKTEDLTLEYSTSASGGQFRISGKVHLDERFAVLDMRIKYLNVNMYFLDPDGRIIESHQVSSTGIQSADRGISFSNEIILPANAHGLAFGYMGSGREAGGGGGGSNTRLAFWSSPQS